MPVMEKKCSRKQCVIHTQYRLETALWDGRRVGKNENRYSVKPVQNYC
jgi:hypothetical protein